MRFVYVLANYDNFDLSSPFITLRLIVWSMFAGVCLAAIGSVYGKRILGSAVRALLKAGATSPETAKTLSEVGCGRNIFVKAALKKETSALRKAIFSAAGDNYYTAPAKIKGMYDKDEAEDKENGSVSPDNHAPDVPDVSDNSATDAPESAEIPAPGKPRYTFIQHVRKFFTGSPYPPRRADVENGRFYVPETLAARAELRYEKKGTDLFMFAVTVLLFLGIAVLAEKYIPELLTMLDDVITSIVSS